MQRQVRLASRKDSDRAGQGGNGGDEDGDGDSDEGESDCGRLRDAVRTAEHRGGWDGVAMCFYVDACGDAIAAAKAARVALRDGGILVCCVGR